MRGYIYIWLNWSRSRTSWRPKRTLLWSRLWNNSNKCNSSSNNSNNKCSRCNSNNNCNHHHLGHLIVCLVQLAICLGLHRRHSHQRNRLVNKLVDLLRPHGVNKTHTFHIMFNVTPVEDNVLERTLRQVCCSMFHYAVYYLSKFDLCELVFVRSLIHKTMDQRCTINTWITKNILFVDWTNSLIMSFRNQLKWRFRRQFNRSRMNKRHHPNKTNSPTSLCRKKAAIRATE